MPDSTERNLLQIIAAGESDRVEFKESLLGDAPIRIREAICAFANDLPGHEKPGRGQTISTIKEDVRCACEISFPGQHEYIYE